MTEITNGSRRPRVLHLATVDSTVRFMLLNQLCMLQRAGYDVAVMSAPGPWVPEIDAAGIPFFPWASSTRSWSPTGDARAFTELVRVLRRERFDILHTHNPKPGVLGRIAGRVAGVPRVVNTVHGLYAGPEDRSRARKALLGAEWVAARLSDFELYQSAEDLARARRLRIASAKRSAYLGNGVDLSRFDPAGIDTARADRLRKEWEIPPDATVVGMVGRLVREKGWLEYVEAARIVRAQRPDVVFLGIGPHDPQKADALTDEDLAGASDAVRFVGHVVEMPEGLSILDLFVLATYREGHPRSAIEAACMGIPLVLTDIRGCREVVPDSEYGMLVPPRHPRELASAILSLLEDPGRRAAMSRENRGRTLRDFDERRVVQRTLAIYDSLLNGASVRARTVPAR